MNGFKISEAADRTGFSESALRFYERRRVVVPQRTASGYRSYSEVDIESLRFVAWSKGLGLSLDEIADLLVLLDGDECRPVQEHMRLLLAARIDETQSKIAEMIAFAGTLQRAASRLAGHTPGGACDDECGCRGDSVSLAGPVPAPDRTHIPLSASDEIACSLEPGLAVDRIDDWKRILAHVEDRHPLANGVRVMLPRRVDIAELAELAAAEQTCCQFFIFTISIHEQAVYLDVTGPDAAQAVIASIFGVAA